MVKLTLIARVADGLPLAEGLETEKNADLDAYKQQAKTLFKRLAAGGHPPPRMSVESGAYCFHYLIEHNVCYLTLADRAYPKKLAYQYLEELAKEFYLQNGTQTASASRPYAFIKFDTFIQKTKKLYLDTRTQRNVSKLQEELAEIQGIVTRNINDVLQSGERLEAVAAMGSALGVESRRYAARAKDLSRQALLRQWLPAIVIAAVVLGLLLLRAALRWLQRR